MVKHIFPFYYHYKCSLYNWWIDGHSQGYTVVRCTPSPLMIQGSNLISLWLSVNVSGNQDSYAEASKKKPTLIEQEELVVGLEHLHSSFIHIWTLKECYSDLMDVNIKHLNNVVIKYTLSWTSMFSIPLDVNWQNIAEW